MRPRLSLLVIAPLISASLAGAQSSRTQVAAFTAILLTPAGALPQLAPEYRPAGRAGIAARYGRYNLRNDSEAFTNIGASGWFDLTPRFQAGATVGRRSCDVCEGSNMGSVDLKGILYHKNASGNTGGDTDVGFEVSAGLAKARKSDVTAKALYLGLPLVVSLPQADDARFSLFLTPAAGFGVLTDTTGTFGGPRFVIGAGAAFLAAGGFGAHLAAHRIAISEGFTQFGLALSWEFGGRRPITR